MDRRIALLMLAAALFVSMGCRMYGAEQDFELTAPWKDYQRIVVRSHNGSVVLKQAGVPDLRIRGTKHARGLTVAEAEQKLERVAIVAQPDPADPAVFTIRLKSLVWPGSRELGASFEIEVPALCAADIQTDNGRIAVSGLEGGAALKTSNGEVTIDRVTGAVRARSGGGRITAENVTGDLTAVTGHGKIRVKAVRGDCELETSNGGVHAEDVCGSLKATLANGDIRVDATPPEDASFVLRTRNGSIHVTLPAGLSADLDLKTGNGVVQTALGKVPMRVQLWSQNRVKAGISGGGGPRIVATTSQGLITVDTR
jgi:hypothetical protein